MRSGWGFGQCVKKNLSEGKHIITSLTSTPDFQPPNLLSWWGSIWMEYKFTFCSFPYLHDANTNRAKFAKSCETRWVCCWAVTNWVEASFLLPVICGHEAVHCCTLYGCYWYGKNLHSQIWFIKSYLSSNYVFFFCSLIYILIWDTFNTVCFIFCRLCLSFRHGYL